jgi:hypothetical protein
MRGTLAGLGVAAALGALVALGSCTHPQGHVVSGDRNSVKIENTGDAAAALELARKHCAEYERVPELRDTDMDYAYYTCVPPTESGPPVHG